MHVTHPMPAIPTATAESPPVVSAHPPRLLRTPLLSAMALAAAVLISGCAVGPDYVRPTMDLPTAYKEPGPWRGAEPGQIDSNHRWWEVYGDSTLNGLVEQANLANQNIRLAAAQYRQAQATAALARASLWPTVGASGGATRALEHTSHAGTGLPATAGDRSAKGFVYTHRSCLYALTATDPASI